MTSPNGRSNTTSATRELKLAFLFGFLVCFTINTLVGHSLAVTNRSALVLNSNGRQVVSEAGVSQPDIQPTSTAAIVMVGRSNNNNNTNGEYGYRRAYYSTREELHGRTQRFPSVDQRLRLYLSSWYAPPCSNESDTIPFEWGLNKTSVQLYLHGGGRGGRPGTTTTTNIRAVANVTASTQHGREVILMERRMMTACDNRYCEDVVNFYFPSLERIGGDLDTPLLLQFGDAEPFHAISTTDTGRKKLLSPEIPILKKFRLAMNTTQLGRFTDVECRTTQQQQRLLEASGVASNTHSQQVHGIVTAVSNYKRHFDPLEQVDAIDTPWEQKSNTVVWRGGLTGRNRGGRAVVVVVGDKQQRQQQQQTATARCELVSRCNLVLRHAQSKVVDARLVKGGNNALHLYDDIATIGSHMFANRTSMQEMLRHKMILILEGNDVSTGLKWALFSESVVLMATPTYTSWLMEELLEPWHHFIPVKEDYSNVEEMARWVSTHESEARKVARQGRLWIADLLFHPNSTKENDEIMDGTLRRYQRHFTARHNP